ncbi:MAG: pyrrolo-quinoline quinone [Gemmataceae bacterium]|nr:pyrrolo-quinoline quinone [Gemmataceae bacterium]
MNPISTSLLVLCLMASAGDQPAGSWSHFRGQGGIAVGNAVLPVEIGPKQYVVWKSPLPAGLSSPVVHGNQVFVTGVHDKKLVTIGLDFKTGKELWRTEAPHKGLEKIHKIGSQAQSSAATDGTHVVVFFGSAGLFCYDRDGKEKWRVPMGPFKTDFGAATSPLLIDGRVILNQDYDAESVLACYDVKTGEQIWKTDRSEFGVGYASPVIWQVKGKKQIVQAGTLRVVGYDFDTGKEIWTVHGMSRVGNMTPSIGPDNVLYVAGWTAGADPGDLIVVPPFDEMVKKHDTNKNGILEAEEIPKGPIKDRLSQFDRNRDNRIDRAEWESMRNIFAAAKNRMVAIRPGGAGDITKTHVVWEQTKQLPYVSSPLVYNGLIFLAKNGGLISTLDPKTGKSLKYDRIQARGNYYSSPVAGDGKVYLVSQQGELTVISARADWEVLHSVDFGEDIMATAALVDGRIFLRTAGHLYCFSSK